MVGILYMNTFPMDSYSTDCFQPKLYTCQTCGKVCKSLHGLTKHVSTTHSMISSVSEQDVVYPSVELFNKVDIPCAIPPEVSNLNQSSSHSVGIKRKYELHTSLDEISSSLDEISSEMWSLSTYKKAQHHTRDDHGNSTGVSNTFCKVCDIMDHCEIASNVQINDSGNRELQVEPSNVLQFKLLDSDDDDGGSSTDVDNYASDPAGISSTDGLVDEYSDSELAVPEFDFISHPYGGWVFDSPEAQTKWKCFVNKNKWFEECSSSNLHHPWRHEGELWLSNYLYRQAHVSMKQSDKLLQKFADGKIIMLQGSPQFQNIFQLHNLLDVAANHNVVGP